MVSVGRRAKDSWQLQEEEEIRAENLRFLGLI